MTFDNALQELLPGSMLEAEFIATSQRACAARGFTAQNTLACVGVCRDELCQPLVVDVHRAWGEAFMLGGLGGMLFCGRTGLTAAHQHAPIDSGRERYAYFCMPHIGIGPAGEQGHCVRRRRDGISSACGALVALRRQLDQGTVDTELDGGDLEMSLLKQRLSKELKPGRVPSLIELTQIARKAITADLETAIGETVDTSRADYCVLTGVQVHAPDGRTFVWPATAYSVVSGERRELGLSSGS